MRRISRPRCCVRAAWAAATAGGATYYVDDFGSDDGGPGTALQPWATLQHAANVVGSGDRVVVRPGDYTGFDFRESGTAAEWPTAELVPVAGGAAIPLGVLDCTATRLVLGGAPAGTTGAHFLKITDAGDHFTPYDQELTAA